MRQLIVSGRVSEPCSALTGASPRSLLGAGPETRLSSGSLCERPENSGRRLRLVDQLRGQRRPRSVAFAAGETDEAGAGALERVRVVLTSCCRPKRRWSGSNWAAKEIPVRVGGSICWRPLGLERRWNGRPGKGRRGATAIGARLLSSLFCTTVAVLALAVGSAQGAPPQWVQMTPTESPPARFGDSMAFDAATNQLVLPDSLSGGTWIWDGAD